MQKTVCTTCQRMSESKSALELTHQGIRIWTNTPIQESSWLHLLRLLTQWIRLTIVDINHGIQNAFRPESRSLLEGGYSPDFTYSEYHQPQVETPENIEPPPTVLKDLHNIFQTNAMAREIELRRARKQSLDYALARSQLEIAEQRKVIEIQMKSRFDYELEKARKQFDDTLEEERREIEKSVIEKRDKEWIESLPAFTQESFWQSFTNDLEKAHTSVLFISPFLHQTRIELMTEHFRNLRARNIRITVITRPANGETKLIELLLMQDITVITLEHIHQKFVVIDNKIIWEGSMNVLSHFGNHGEHMRRIENSEIVNRTFKLHGLDTGSHHPLSICEAALVVANPT